jgi:site-specific recombinase XerD
MPEFTKPLAPLPARIGELLRTDSGRFANPEDNLDGARNDAEATLAWLQTHKNSPNTLRAYVRHLEVLLTWLDLNRLRLSGLTRPQALAFIEWCAMPPEEFIFDPEHPERPGTLFQPVMATKTKAKQPLEAKTSPAARNQRLGALNSLFKHMVSGGYTRANPFSGVKAEQQTGSLERRFRSLDETMLDDVTAEIDALEEPERSRTRLVIIGITRLAARRSEAALARLGDFLPDEKGQWWWRVAGKGNKGALVPVHPDVMDVLWAYREAAGLPRTWEPRDTSPLFPGMKGEQVTDEMHYQHIKALFLRASLRLDGTSADRLRRATPHWLRHTGLTRLVQTNPIHVVKEIARHSRVDTTTTYTTVSSDQLHEANRKTPL